VVDDDGDSAEVLCELLRLAGFSARSEVDPTEALVTDLRMQPTDGLALCEQVGRTRSDLPVVLITGHASVEAAVGALRAGAFDFIVKPVDAELLALTLDRAIIHHRLQSEVHRLRAEVLESRSFDLILGDSAPMRAVARAARARSSSRVRSTLGASATRARSSPSTARR
jgi:two-component system response regulator HydG